MARLNGRRAIMAYLGYKTVKVWSHLVAVHGLPFFRDLNDPRRVFAYTEALDAWDIARSEQNGTADTHRKPENRNAERVYLRDRNHDRP